MKTNVYSRWSAWSKNTWMSFNNALWTYDTCCLAWFRSLLMLYFMPLTKIDYPSHLINENTFHEISGWLESLPFGGRQVPVVLCCIQCFFYQLVKRGVRLRPKGMVFGNVVSPPTWMDILLRSILVFWLGFSNMFLSLIIWRPFASTSSNVLQYNHFIFFSFLFNLHSTEGRHMHIQK